ncbi:hypothetical protein [Candidatus Chlamydia sanziniae]|uniref:Uncharacterized protein n=1 Tax=Candidatus Chlamydia sanziniae TaxID=1806891 RepID=A0A1A9HU70_9CHLA|nr:hypothetical protein [Candidatus Chlamydia sanziniae]ANH78257.1 hypothetical protein Cs308_0086 [Candidatus Chlamydia sanziniae]
MASGIGPGGPRRTQDVPYPEGEDNPQLEEETGLLGTHGISKGKGNSLAAKRSGGIFDRIRSGVQRVLDLSSGEGSNKAAEVRHSFSTIFKEEIAEQSKQTPQGTTEIETSGEEEKEEETGRTSPTESDPLEGTSTFSSQAGASHSKMRAFNKKMRAFNKLKHTFNQWTLPTDPPPPDVEPLSSSDLESRLSSLQKMLSDMADSSEEQIELMKLIEITRQQIKESRGETGETADVIAKVYLPDDMGKSQEVLLDTEIIGSLGEMELTSYVTAFSDEDIDSILSAGESAVSKLEDVDEFLYSSVDMINALFPPLVLPEESFEESLVSPSLLEGAEGFAGPEDSGGPSRPSSSQASEVPKASAAPPLSQTQRVWLGVRGLILGFLNLIINFFRNLMARLRLARHAAAEAVRRCIACCSHDTDSVSGEPYPSTTWYVNLEGNDNSQEFSKTEIPGIGGPHEPHTHRDFLSSLGEWFSRESSNYREGAYWIKEDQVEEWQHSSISFIETEQKRDPIVDSQGYSHLRWHGSDGPSVYEEMKPFVRPTPDDHGNSRLQEESMDDESIYEDLNDEPVYEDLDNVKKSQSSSESSSNSTLPTISPSEDPFFSTYTHEDGSRSYVFRIAEPPQPLPSPLVEIPEGFLSEAYALLVALVTTTARDQIMRTPLSSPPPSTPSDYIDVLSELGTTTMILQGPAPSSEEESEV